MALVGSSPAASSSRLATAFAASPVHASSRELLPVTPQQLDTRLVSFAAADASGSGESGRSAASTSALVLAGLVIAPGTWLSRRRRRRHGQSQQWLSRPIGARWLRTALQAAGPSTAVTKREVAAMTLPDEPIPDMAKIELEDIMLEKNGTTYLLVMDYMRRTELWVDGSKIAGDMVRTRRGMLCRDGDRKWAVYKGLPRDITHLTQRQLDRFERECRIQFDQLSPTAPDGKEEEEEEEDMKLKYAPKGKVPEMEEWQWFEAPMPEEVLIPEELSSSFTRREFTDRLKQFNPIVARWTQKASNRKGLGFTAKDEQEDILAINAGLNSLKAFDKVLNDWSKFNLGKKDEVPYERRRYFKVWQITVLAGSKGLAAALWRYDEALKHLYIDLLLSDDVLTKGQLAEEALFKMLLAEAKEKGATKIWARSQCGDGGQVVKPPYWDEFDFIPWVDPTVEEQKSGDKEIEGLENMSETDRILATFGLTSVTVPKEIEEVDGLRIWLKMRDLLHHEEAVLEWCRTNGAVLMREVRENRKDISKDLADVLTEEEQERLAHM